MKYLICHKRADKMRIWGNYDKWTGEYTSRFSEGGREIDIFALL